MSGTPQTRSSALFTMSVNFSSQPEPASTVAATVISSGLVASAATVARAVGLIWRVAAP